VAGFPGIKGSRPENTGSLRGKDKKTAFRQMDKEPAYSSEDGGVHQ
jgi:hypothetical protein